MGVNLDKKFPSVNKPNTGDSGAGLTPSQEVNVNKIPGMEQKQEELSSSLDAKANDNVVVKKGYGTLSDFDEETRRVLQGLEEGQINAVLGKGNVNLENLSDEVVKTIKGNNLLTGTQMFNYTVNGSSVTYKCTNFISVKKGDKISISKTWQFLVELDSSNNYIGEHSLSSTTSAIIVNGNCTKIVFTKKNTTEDYSDTIVVLGDMNNYVPDKKSINLGLIKNINSDNLADGSITISKMDNSFTEIEKGNNLYKINEHQNGKTITDKDGNVVATANMTNYIPTIVGEKYCSSLYGTQFYHFNSDKVYISHETQITNPSVVIAKGSFMLVRGDKNENIKIVQGTNLDNVTNDKVIINKNLLPISKGYESRLNGKKWIVIGDSISVLAEKNYHDFVGNDLGIMVANIAVSGRTMLDGIGWVDTMSSNYDLVTVMMGTNDHGYNCGIGSFNDGVDYTSNSSFYARVQKMIEKLRLKNPNAQIVFLTPIRRHGTGSQNNNSEGFMVNALNKTTKDYVDVIKDCCNRLGVHCLDLYENGLDPRDTKIREKYFMGINDGTHPNNLGQATFIAPKVRDFLEKIAPYSIV